jgi:hypothetical protein
MSRTIFHRVTVMTRDNYQQDKKSAIAWVMGIVAVLLTGGLGFLSTQLIAHETAIAVIREKQTAAERVQEEMRSDIKELLRRTPKP